MLAQNFKTAEELGLSDVELGALVTVLAVCSAVLVVANIQGAVAPFASLISMQRLAW